MEGAHGVFGGGAKGAIDGDGRNLIIVQGNDPQEVLGQTHRFSAAASAQDAAGTLGRQGNILAAQLRQAHDRYIDIGDLIPGGGADNTIGGQIEDALEGPHRTLHFSIVGIAAGGADGGNGRIIAADAVEPGADGADILSAAADGKRRTRIRGGDAALYRGGIDDDVIPIVVAQNAQRRVAVIGQGNGAPLGKSPAGDGGAIAVLCKDGVDRAAAADVLIE